MGPIGMTDAFEIPDELGQFLSLEEGEANFPGSASDKVTALRDDLQPLIPAD